MKSCTKALSRLQKRLLVEANQLDGYFVWIRFNPLVTHSMAKKGDLTLKHMAFGWLEFHSVPLQSVKAASRSQCS